MGEKNEKGGKMLLWSENWNIDFTRIILFPLQRFCERNRGNAKTLKYTYFFFLLMSLEELRTNPLTISKSSHYKKASSDAVQALLEI